MNDTAETIDAQPGERVDRFLQRVLSTAQITKQTYKARHNAVTTGIYPESDIRDVFEKHELNIWVANARTITH
jgi:hypothetical protein